MKKEEFKICLISSSGGHLSQLKELIPISNKYNYFIITEKNGSSQVLKEQKKVYFLNQQNRKSLDFFPNVTKNICVSLKYILKERPEIIISTGAGAVIPFCFFGKILGAKVVFLESFAKVNSPTITGRIIYRFADQFYIQSKGLSKFYKKAKFKGTIY